MLFTDKSLCAFPPARKGDCHYVHRENLRLHMLINSRLSRASSSSLSPLFASKSSSNLHKALQFLFQQLHNDTSKRDLSCHARITFNYNCSFDCLSCTPTHQAEAVEGLLALEASFTFTYWSHRLERGCHPQVSGGYQM